MFAVPRIATPVLVLSFSGALALSINLSAPTTAGLLTAAVSSPSPIASIDPMAPSFFKGTSPPSTACLISDGTSNTVEGVVERRDVSYGCFKWTTNDPRINGVSKVIWHSDEYTDAATTGERGSIVAIRERIENDAGAWEGTETELDLPDSGFSQLAGWFVGEGAYEGLVAYIVITDADTTADVWGMITPRGRLEPPAAFVDE